LPCFGKVIGVPDANGYRVGSSTVGDVESGDRPGLIGVGRYRREKLNEQR